MRCHHQVWNSARYVQAQRMMCTTQSSVGVLVVHCELHVVRVVPVVVCNDAVVRRTLGLIAFVVAIFQRILLYWRYSIYSTRGQEMMWVRQHLRVSSISST